MAVASQDLYSKSMEVLNENLTNLGISIDIKEQKDLSYILIVIKIEMIQGLR